jgi:arginyl-tRNA--protein-N-Asp/Glu arginylyltransferase
LSLDLQPHQRNALRQFYTTGAAPCPYLDGRTERRVYTLLRRHPQERETFDRLSEAGFRRSQNLMYRPACPGCDACVPVRIPVERFRPSRSERKVLHRNADLSLHEAPAVPTSEHWELFHRYLDARHGDGGMAGMTRVDFETMVGDWTVATLLLEGRDAAGRLVAVSLTDRLASGYSGVYKFYEPDESRRSLGTWTILQLVEKARQDGLPYVYLGYWIAGSEKMDYKARFRPMEQLTHDGWVDMPDEAAQAAEAGKVGPGA